VPTQRPPAKGIGVVSQEDSNGGVELTNPIHLVARLRMNPAIPPYILYIPLRRVWGIVFTFYLLGDGDRPCGAHIILFRDYRMTFLRM
jgi:hypothetical protein